MRDARRAMLLVARAWAGFAGVEPPETMRLPRLDSELEEELNQAHDRVDDAYEAIDDVRDTALAEQLLGMVSLGDLKKAGASDLELCLLKRIANRTVKPIQVK
jgi:hypothetical protein